MKFYEFAEMVIGKYEEKFPESMCKVREYKCIGKSIVIDCFLSGKNSGINCSGVASNDMFKICFNISLPDKFNFETEELPENLELIAWQNTYLINPENKYLCYESRKIPFRKTKGDAKKIIVVLEKFFEKLYISVLEDIKHGNIHKNYTEIVAEKVR